MKWVVVAVPLVLLALFPVMVLAADRMRPNRPAPAPKVRPVRTRPIPVPPPWPALWRHRTRSCPTSNARGWPGPRWLRGSRATSTLITERLLS